MCSYMKKKQVTCPLFSYSSQLSTKFIRRINIKMPTIIGNLTFISMINTTSGRFKARNFFICRYFSVYEHLKLRAQLSGILYSYSLFEKHSIAIQTVSNVYKCRRKKL